MFSYNLQGHVIVNIARLTYVAMVNAKLYFLNSLANTGKIVQNRRH